MQLYTSCTLESHKTEARYDVNDNKNHMFNDLSRLMKVHDLRFCCRGVSMKQLHNGKQFHIKQEVLDTRRSDSN